MATYPVHPLAAQLPAEAWQHRDMADALACRDIGVVYRILHRYGLNHRQLAAIGRHQESEVSGIINGHREVNRYDVLERIADSFGIERGRMGLGTDYLDEGGEKGDEDVKRRQLLSLAAAAVTGLPLPDVAFGDDGHQLWDASKLGVNDIAQLHDMRRSISRLNDQFGGAANYNMSCALLSRARGLLKTEMTDLTREKLLSFISHMHSHVGWSASDCGSASTARTHFDHSLRFAHEANDNLQKARTLSFAGRSELQWGNPNEALKIFQFGSLASDSARSHLLASTIDAHGAQAAAITGNPNMARSMVERAYDQYASVGEDDPASRYPESDITSAVSAVRFALGDVDDAIADIETAAREQQADMTRSRAFRYSRLALFHLAAGDLDEGLSAGHQAVTVARSVRSARVLGRLAPVGDAAAKYPGNRDARDLARATRALVS